MNPSRVARRPLVGLLQGVLAAVAVVAVLAGCGGGGSDRVSEPPTTVFGRQAEELAVGLAAQRRGTLLGVTTTVLDQSGSRRRNLKLDLASGRGRWVAAKACGAGRYCGEVPVSGPRPLVRVRLVRPGGRASALSFRLPRDPQPKRAGALVHASGAAVRGLHSLIIGERLGSGPRYAPLVTQFNYVAPDRLSYRIEGGGESVVIGGKRWDREDPKGAWQVSEQEPLRVPSSDWRRVRDASVLGSGVRDGRPVWRVSFYDPT